MEQLFKLDLGKIRNISKKEILERKKNLDLFFDNGLPNKKDENWKFSDFNFIINKNFKHITNNQEFQTERKIEVFKDFEHNYIILVNGTLTSSDMKFEKNGKVKLESLNSFENFNYHSENNLSFLNKALSSGGFELEIKENYKCNKPIVIYNYFTSNLENKIVNNSNKIKMNQNSELTLIEFNITEESKFLKNTFEEIVIDSDSILKHIMIQKNKSNGYFYKNISGSQGRNSSYQNFILSSGLKFNKIEIDMSLKKEHCNCFILSGLFLNSGEHQEIKTRINHLAPNCKSYQKVKNVLESDGVGVFQGKIFVIDEAQKTDAYQLSKALILNDKGEFNAKPELEIYADDVKCSHGSTSGSIDEDAVHYLMTRGIKQSDAKKLLINGFLNEIFDKVSDLKIKNFLEKNIERQINGI